LDLLAEDAKGKTEHIYTPRTQMTLILIEKGLVLEGSASKIEDKQVPGK